MRFGRYFLVTCPACLARGGKRSVQVRERQSVERGQSLFHALGAGDEVRVEAPESTGSLWEMRGLTVEPQRPAAFPASRTLSPSTKV